jgi:phasin family protein
MTKATATPAGKKAAGAKKTSGPLGPFMFPAAFPASFPSMETLFPGLEKLPSFKGLEGFKGFEGIAEQNAENLKAAVAAGTALIKVVDAVTKEMASFATDSFSAGITAAKEISECKTIADMFERQSAYARAVLERMISESTKLSRLSVDAAKDTMVPINLRMEEATEKFMKAMAA